MANYRLTKKADSDITQLYEYGILNFGLNQAQSYLLGLYDDLDHLVQNPLLGHSAHELSLGLRRFEYQSHVIFYEPEEDGVLVVRILRGEMDFRRHL